MGGPVFVKEPSMKTVFLLHPTRAGVLLLSASLGAVALAQTSGTAAPSTAAGGSASPDSTALDKLVREFSAWAGSRSNAQSLVQGLRSGSTVTLRDTGSSTGAPTTVDPATAKMGVGEVRIALSLAKAQLAQAGVTQPTAAQLGAALGGGLVSSSSASTSLPGVLNQRASGMGWGQIAQAMGVKLGSLMSASAPGQVAKADKTGKTSKTDPVAPSAGAAPAQPGGQGSGASARGHGADHAGGGHSGGGGGGGGGGKK